MQSTDVKKPAGDWNPTAGSTDNAIVPRPACTSNSPLSLAYTALSELALRCWCATPSRWLRGTIRTKAKAPVRSNTFSEAVAIPTEKRDFVSSKFLGLVQLHRPRIVLGGMGLPARMAARLQACLKHPVHLLRVQTQTVAFFGSPVGNQP